MNETFFKRDFSFFGRACHLNGQFELKGPVKIQSHIEGEIDHLGEDLLSIEPEGKINGNLTCHDLHIFGEFDGSITAKGKVTLFPTAIVSGTIQSHKLVIHPGAVLNIKGNTLELS